MKITNVLSKALAVLLLSLVSGSAFAQFKVIGYLPSWNGEVSNVQFTKLTHVNYAFLLPNADGSVQAIENPAKLQNLVSTAHANGVKVLISVGGWMHDGNPTEFVSIGNNTNYTSTFTTNLVNFVAQYNLDGVDIDWEHPTANSANGYAAVMQSLATQMHSRGKLLTTAVAGGTWAGPSIQNSVLANVDFLNIMAYDDAAPAHSTYDLASQSITYWRGRGLPASKTVLGVPFYGQPNGAPFSTLLAQGANPNADLFNGVGYNGISTIKSKTNLAFDQAGGIMIWHLGQDATGANSLLTAINQVVVSRSTVAPPPPPTTRQAIPGTIQAESYAAMSGVDTEGTTDAGGGRNVDWVDTGDWLEYAVNVQTSGNYSVGFRVASATGGAQLQLRNSTGTSLGSVSVENTGGWQNWVTRNVTVSLPAGAQTLRVYAAASTGCNINWISFATAGMPPPPASSFTIQAEAFNNMNGVQVESTTDAGGGQNVGYIDAGDWLSYYNVNFPTSGAYLIEYRVASYSGSTLSSDLNGGAIQLGSVAIPATGGWQTWRTITQTVNVNAGTYNFGLYAQGTGWNLNWIRISKAGGRPAVAAKAEASPVLTVYPNPVADQFTVSSAVSLAGSTYRIVNALGRHVASGTLEHTNTVNVAALQTGMYTLEVTAQDQPRLVSRFSKQ